MLMGNNLNKTGYIRNDDGSKGLEPEEKRKNFDKNGNPSIRYRTKKTDSSAKIKKQK